MTRILLPSRFDIKLSTPGADDDMPVIVKDNVLSVMTAFWLVGVKADPLTLTIWVVSNFQPLGRVIVCVPVEISPAAPSVIVGPLNSVNVSVPPLAEEVVSIEIFVPPLAGVTVTPAKAEFGAKKPLTIIVAAALTINSEILIKFKAPLPTSRERERVAPLHEMYFYSFFLRWLKSKIFCPPRIRLNHPYFII